jgi:hypothetical protein
MRAEESTEGYQKTNQPLNQSASLTKIARKYQKMERYYQTFNKEYDPYSRTMHPHPIFNTNFFEVNQASREEIQKEDIDNLKMSMSCLDFDIFQTNGAKMISPVLDRNENSKRPIDRLG